MIGSSGAAWKPNGGRLFNNGFICVPARSNFSARLEILRQRGFEIHGMPDLSSQLTNSKSTSGKDFMRRRSLVKCGKFNMAACAPIKKSGSTGSSESLRRYWRRGRHQRAGRRPWPGDYSRNRAPSLCLDGLARPPAATGLRVHQKSYRTSCASCPRCAQCSKALTQA